MDETGETTDFLLTAQWTFVGIELMHMLKKRQIVVEEGKEGFTPAEQFYALAPNRPSAKAYDISAQNLRQIGLRPL